MKKLIAATLAAILGVSPAYAQFSGGGGGSTYTLPQASTSTLGGIKADPSGSLNVSGAGVATVPSATTSTPGLTTVGAGTGTSAAPMSGGLVPCANLPVDSSTTNCSGGKIVATGGGSYTLPIASSSTLGGIKPDGSTITVNASTGVASASGGGGSISTTSTYPTTTNTTVTPSRSLGARAIDRYNVRDFGAIGVFGGSTILSSSYPSCVTSFAAFTGCFSWASGSQYGLTFPLTIPTGDSATGTDINMLVTGYATYNSTANVALWQELSNAFAIPVVGMSITSPTSGTGANCLTAGTTISAVGADPTGTFTYGGAYTYGHIKLNQSVASTCPAGTVLTFTLTPSQLGSLTTDWLGIQNAVANSDASQVANNVYGGNTVYIPSGFYTVNHPIYWYAAGVPQPSTNFVGDNWQSSRIIVNLSAGSPATYNPLLPYGSCVFEPSDRSVNPATRSSFSEMSAEVYGDGASHSYGSIPNPFSGFCAAETTEYRRVQANNGFLAGFEFNAASVKYENVASYFNGYGIYAGKYAQANGAFFQKNSDAGPNYISDIEVACTNQIDASGLDTIHAFGSPYAIAQEACPSNVTTPGNALLTNSSIKDYFAECIGDAFIYSPTAAVTGNLFIGGYSMNAGQSYCTGYHGAVNVNAPITVSIFSQNTMLQTQWGTGFSNSIFAANAAANSTTPSIIRVSSGYQNNTFRDDQSIISFGSAAFPFVYSTSNAYGYGNKFEVGDDGQNAHRNGKGLFEYCYSSISAAGAPLGNNAAEAQNAAGVVEPYAWGDTFAGVSGATCNAGGFMPVYWEYSGQYSVPNSAGQIAGGTPVFPAPGGFYPSVGTPGDVGSQTYPISYGAQYGNLGNGIVSGITRSTPSNTVGATAVVGASITGYATSGASTITLSTTASGTLSVGQAMTGQAGIVPGTVINSISGSTINISIPTIAAFGSSGSPVTMQAGFAIVSANTDFTTVASGSYAILSGNVPVGYGERVCNDGANTLTIYGPPGEPFATTPTLATGVCADYRRLSATAWR